MQGSGSCCAMVFHSFRWRQFRKKVILRGGSIDGTARQRGRDIRQTGQGALHRASIVTAPPPWIKLDRPVLKCSPHLGDASATVKEPVRPPHLSSGPEKPPTKPPVLYISSVHLPLETGAGGQKADAVDLVLLHPSNHTSKLANLLANINWLVIISPAIPWVTRRYYSYWKQKQFFKL